MSHFLFVIPNFLSGVGSTIDLAGALEDHAYNISGTPAEADWKASLADWRAVRAELRAALNAIEAETAEASEQPSAE